jgi:hypothetical protein
MLKNSIKKNSGSWRRRGVNFIPRNPSHILEGGAVTFSAGWFAQGHTVSLEFHSITPPKFISKQGKNHPLLPSRNIRTESHLGSQKWIKITNNSEKFINLTLSLIHPNLFTSGLLILKKLRKLKATKVTAKEWQSVYTGIAVVSNRETPPHRDSGGRPEWYDTLINYSGTGGNPRLQLNSLGMDLEYSTGTVVSFCGSILEHEVRHWGTSDRACYAHFMRESVRKRFDVPPAGWVEQNMYLPGQT